MHASSRTPGCLVSIVMTMGCLLVASPGRGQEESAPPRVEERPEVRQALPSREEIAKLPADGGPGFNRLIHESSPYLLQHARNPVDWHPWGPEAFEKAKREDKAVFLSIGYSTCHWCHVMEHESFENEAIAEVLNAHFVAIKVDREERPDVDNVYMAAVQALTGRGGWPMSVFLTPERQPFWGGTYFPPDDRLGQPGFRTILLALSEAWKNDRENLLANAGRLTAHIRSQSGLAGRSEVGIETLTRAVEQYAAEFDAARGGFGSAPKFPRSHSLSLLLRAAHRGLAGNPGIMVERTLDAMALGGVHDHLGGGFHRYSTDAEWLVPHFEKMLYDQALLATTYLESWQAGGRARDAAVARDIFSYVLRDLVDPSGGFQSAEDADSEGIEGKFYVWTLAEILSLLGEQDGALFADVYTVDEAGNFHDELTGKSTGVNILHLERPIPEYAREHELDAATLETRLAEMRGKLFAVRKARIHPYKDDKVLTDWNGLMIAALARGGRVLDEPSYTLAARRAAAFVLDTLRNEGRLLHRYRDGHVSIKGFLDDHAFLIVGLLELYETTFETRWLAEARHLARQMLDLFWDVEAKGFRFSGSDDESLIAETKELYDGALPSGNSVAMLALLRLGQLLADPDLEGFGRATLEAFSGAIARFPMGYPYALMALDLAVGPTHEIVLAGDAADPRWLALRAATRAPFLPRSVVAWRPLGPGAQEVLELLPYLKDLGPIGGAPAAYVCQDHTCQLPVTTVEALAPLLE